MSNQSSENKVHSFYMLPKELLISEKYRALSAEAKLLYALMYSRKTLSEANGWVDAGGRVYIYFTVKEISEVIGCGCTKATKLLNELESYGGTGLIRRKKQGLGKPNRIYINSLYDKNVDNEVDKPVDKCVEKNAGQGLKSGKSAEASESVDKPEEKSVDKHVDKEDAQCCVLPDAKLHSTGKHICRALESEAQDGCKTKTNYNDRNYIYNNYNDSVLSYHTSHSQNPDPTDSTEKRKRVRNTVCSNIDYAAASDTFGKEWTDELVELIVDVLCSPHSTVRISKTDYPAEVVRERFEKLTYFHIENVYFAMRTVNHRIGNIRSYMLTALFHSVETTQSWMYARVRADMAGG